MQIWEQIDDKNIIFKLGDTILIIKSKIPFDSSIIGAF